MQYQPVTQTADVEVNIASRKGAPPGPLVEMGSIKRKPPVKITIKKPKLII